MTVDVLEDWSAREYLRPPFQSFWRWSLDGQALVWQGGGTIAFAEELRVILDCLAPMGLPPLSSLVLVLGALRVDWREQGLNDLKAFFQTVFGYAEPDFYSSLMRGLDHLQSLPEGRLRTLPGKRLLAEVLFESDPGAISVDQSLENIRGAERILGRESGITAELELEAATPVVLRKSLKYLCEALPELDEERLQLRDHSGFDDAPLPATLEDPPLTRLRALLAGLEDDDEMGALARFTRSMMAAVSVPRSTALPDQMAVGGLSGLSNRGRLDRLLITELAHDDLVLAARVAGQEALYWHREPPPKSPPKRRRIYLDFGIRMWGKARLFAVGVALAMVLRSDPENPAELLTVDDNQLTPMAWETRADLAKILGSLRPHATPGDELRVFLEQSDDSEERIILTHEAVLSDADFLDVYRELECPSVFVATVSRGGEFCLWSLNERGRKCHQRAELDLEALISPRQRSLPGQPLVGAKVDGRLPDLCFMEPFPLRLAHRPLRAKELYSSVTGGLFAFSRDGRLLQWSHPGHGARQLTDSLPRGQLIWMGELNPECLVLAMKGHDQIHIVWVHWKTGQCQSVSRSLAYLQGGFLAAWAYNGGLFVKYQGAIVHVFDLQSGEYLENHVVPYTYSWSNDRFYRDRSGQWLALNFDGQSCHLDPVPVANDNWVLFDRQGFEGPWAFDPRGRVVSTVNSSREIPVGRLYSPPFQYIDRSLDGHILLVRSMNSECPNQYICCDLKTGKSWAANNARIDRNHALTEFYSSQLTNQYNMRTRIYRLGRVRGHKLAIVDRHMKTMALTTDREGAINFVAARGLTIISPRGFSKLDDREHRRLGLKMAAWPSGSQAVLDARGLLHCQFPDQERPDLCLIMSTQGMGLWVANGEYYGPEHMLPPQHKQRRISLEDAHNWLARFAETLI